MSPSVPRLNDRIASPHDHTHPGRCTTNSCSKTASSSGACSAVATLRLSSWRPRSPRSGKGAGRLRTEIPFSYRLAEGSKCRRRAVGVKAGQPLPRPWLHSERLHRTRHRGVSAHCGGLIGYPYQRGEVNDLHLASSLAWVLSNLQTGAIIAHCVIRPLCAHSSTASASRTSKRVNISRAQRSGPKGSTGHSKGGPRILSRSARSRRSGPNSPCAAGLPKSMVSWSRAAKSSLLTRFPRSGQPSALVDE